MAIYYDIRDDGTDPTNDEDNFGLVQNDYSDKPAIVAVRTLTAAAKGRTFAGFLPVGFTSLHAMLLVGPSDRVVALWSDAPGSVTSVALPAGATLAKATDLLGAPLSLVTDGGAMSVTVGEVAGPVFLTFPNPPGAGDGGADGSAGSGGTGDGGAQGSLDASAGGDASADAGMSGGSASHGSSGCGCATVGDDARGLSLAGLGGAVLGLAVVLARRRRTRA
jgi:MYXO-CTERM domain-containing protein